MFSYTMPISFDTDINPIISNYMTGLTMGIRPFWMQSGNLWGGSLFNPGPVYNWGNSGNSFGNSLFSFGNYYSNNFYFGDSNRFIGPDVNIFKLGTTDPLPASPVTEVSKPQEVPKTEKEPVKENPVSEKEKLNKELGEKLVANAYKYKGYNEADGSFRKFSDSPEWCADFVTYVVKETYKEKGITCPEGFGNHRTEVLKNWAIDNDSFLQVANKTNRGKLITQNVKPGDIMILRENNASHTGFVTAVHPDGSFETIEGNRDDKVATAHYSADYSDLTGFIQLRV